MFAYPIKTAALALTAIVGLSACTTPYGYGGVSVGAGNGYYDPYYGGYGYGAGYPAGYGYGAGYPGYGYGAGYPGYGYAYAPYWGWYDDFYYPGTGYYVYDAYRQPHRWTDAQRRYWTQRRDQAVATSTTAQPVVVRDNWDDFKRDRTTSRQSRIDRNTQRIERRETTNVERTRPIQVERQRVERSRPVRAERTERQQVERSANVERAERQAVRDQRRSDARAERATRSEARDQTKNWDE